MEQLDGYSVSTNAIDAAAYDVKDDAQKTFCQALIRCGFVGPFRFCAQSGVNLAPHFQPVTDSLPAG